jgi:hypothetical protein
MTGNKLKKTLSLVVEPIALGLVALLFIIPAITVVNLQPLTKELKKLDVLGVTNTSDLKINIVGGTHQIFFNERIQSDESGKYTYTTKLTKREADSYSKPILEIVNNKEGAVNLDIYGSTSLPTGSDIGIIIKDQRYRLQESNGSTQNQKITIYPNERYIVYLYIESFSDVQFEEDFELTIYPANL